MASGLLLFLQQRSGDDDDRVLEHADLLCEDGFIRAIGPALHAEAEAGAAELLLEGEFDAKTLYEKALSLLKSPEKLAKMSENMALCGVPDATNRITELVLDYVK